jgi:hypothetical protein
MAEVTLGLPVYKHVPKNLLVHATNHASEAFLNIRFTVRKLSGELHIVVPKATGTLLQGASHRAFESGWTNFPGWRVPFRVRAQVLPTTIASETTVVAV